MKFKGVYDIIKVDEYSATPKYLQLANSILNGVDNEVIRKNDTLPSINELSYRFDISRDTAEKGYSYLKKIGVLGSVPGKGYFIKNTDFKRHLKIFLLFNKLSAHKKIIYDSFVQTLGDAAAIDFYVYNNDFPLFKKLFTNRKDDDYTHYVIIPHFLEESDAIVSLINTIPKDKLLLLDKVLPGITGEYAAVYENFFKDIHGSLTEAKAQLAKYKILKIIFPKDSYYPIEIIKGFQRFCKENGFVNKIINDISTEEINAGDVYINLMEDDLVLLIERVIALKLKVGKDVGIISYNETPLKKIILDGITTISTDFKEIGVIAAQLILEKECKKVEVPFHLTLRRSL